MGRLISCKNGKDGLNEVESDSTLRISQGRDLMYVAQRHLVLPKSVAVTDPMTTRSKPGCTPLDEAVTRHSFVMISSGWPADVSRVKHVNPLPLDEIAPSQARALNVAYLPVRLSGC